MCVTVFRLRNSWRDAQALGESKARATLKSMFDVQVTPGGSGSSNVQVVDLDQVARILGNLDQKQIPFAASIALNRTAELSRPALRAFMSYALDRPKPYTLNSIFIKRATKSNLTAKVFHSDVVSRYLRPEIEGGTRGIKPFEELLDSSIYVPAGGVKLDRYGNLPRSLLRAVVDAAKSPTGTDSKGTFVVRVGDKSRLPPGVYRRTLAGKKGAKRKGFEALLFKTPSAKYAPTYDMLGVVKRVADAEFGKQFEAALEYALRTAR